MGGRERERDDLIHWNMVRKGREKYGKGEGQIRGDLPPLADGETMTGACKRKLQKYGTAIMYGMRKNPMMLPKNPSRTASCSAKMSCEESIRRTCPSYDESF